eukprot:TRINITY_DN111262_c0_g1_i1.p2 TRINITY_DN111262_c0_g1~~TRINITY_DN111262_c0_g1_i1.p2  ORF type:complete len:225 (+),score=73.56 TRINITY_DN111262_c0_g1_i1:71-676(+)
MGFGDASAKDKKAASAKAKDDAAKKAAEDASWAETDKGNVKKAGRAADAAAKADAKLAAKAELKELERAEDEANASAKGANKKQPTKVTQAEIARRQALMAAMAGKPKAKVTKKTETVDAPKIEANTNRQQDVVDASGLDAALSALEGGGEKKSKMTYGEFEAREMEGIKQENPGLKMSQVKERCFKMWERSPDNPKNQEK